MFQLWGTVIFNSGWSCEPYQKNKQQTRIYFYTASSNLSKISSSVMNDEIKKMFVLLMYFSSQPSPVGQSNSLSCNNQFFLFLSILFLTFFLFDASCVLLYWYFGTLMRGRISKSRFAVFFALRKMKNVVHVTFRSRKLLLNFMKHSVDFRVSKLLFRGKISSASRFNKTFRLIFFCVCILIFFLFYFISFFSFLRSMSERCWANNFKSRTFFMLAKHHLNFILLFFFPHSFCRRHNQQPRTQRVKENA